MEFHQFKSRFIEFDFGCDGSVDFLLPGDTVLQPIGVKYPGGIGSYRFGVTGLKSNLYPITGDHTSSKIRARDAQGTNVDFFQSSIEPPRQVRHSSHDTGNSKESLYRRFHLQLPYARGRQVLPAHCP
jgi:hypothetical protein